jgi:hypothetical protein
MRHECRYLIDLHHVEWTILLFHSPTHHGPVDAMCADCRRKIPWASMDMLRDRDSSSTPGSCGTTRATGPGHRRWTFFAAK